MNDFDSSSTGGESASPTPEIRSTPKIKGDNRTPIKHILIGTPQVVEFTMRRLDQLGYVDAIEWAQPLNLNEPLNIVPEPGDVISLLVRYLRFQ
ncbi:hypothetical protein H6F67_19970 [Microcoleus sp. FACHB-1515]|uniref:hypothetical protein n=1 Tax=Cyanophyceae TaxID=3028117 RepID=UPI001688BEE4|nr:hypothetical protein [Microcoleus sp. FACHB-1515]MBD2092130.1 hypothetical protein [Microcoleus sp. FACHB-1515]